MRLVSLIDFLVLSQVSINTKDRDGRTPLHHAVMHDYDDGVKRLLKEWGLKIEVKLFKKFKTIQFLIMFYFAFYKLEGSRQSKHGRHAFCLQVRALTG